MYKIILLINLILVLVSLFSGAFFLAKDNGLRNRMFGSLALRISLSITLLILIITGYFMGWITPHS
ncbi:MAG: twin transmembrane helix small protein [Candidatus Berkiella sp.]